MGNLIPHGTERCPTLYYSYVGHWLRVALGALGLHVVTVKTHTEF